ncbi:DUF1127 domain-containing protein [Mangrovicoccus algicola]|uniref:DUF1127 domain-containing protein n=1 Tax=Mangrovicoccus algicola TaxID=2771008 RepID=A0A8J6YW17_9RHOB|nr:DUF1127 domain-containing protein [Mangrovicoccus algicola]MBE3638677.1 DUF1127 domain-containing protein [Mangrovicoccus algicola]
MSDQTCPRPAPRLLRLPRLARLRLAERLALARQRRHLRHLDAHLLRDVGLTRAEAERESQRPPWDAPHWWK